MLRQYVVLSSVAKLTVQAKSIGHIHQDDLDSAVQSKEESLLLEMLVSVSRSAICCLLPLILLVLNIEKICVHLLQRV